MKILPVLTLFVSTAVLAASATETPFIRTSGLAQMEVVADSARLTLDVEATGDTVEVSNARLDELVSEFVSAVGRLGVASDAVTLARRHSRAMWDFENGKRVFHGFASVASFLVRLDAMDRYDELLTFLSTNSGYGSVNAELRYSKEGDVRRDLLLEAVAAARAKADALAAANHLEITHVLEIAEDAAQPPQLFEGAALRANFAGDQANPTGRLTTTIAIGASVRFALRPALGGPGR